MPHRPLPPTITGRPIHPLNPFCYRCHHRQFHSTPRALADLENHYETLQISSSASPAEIKRQFYSLSKQCHPDRNPSDPEASSKFARLSTAYSVLGDAQKRGRYDRDFHRANAGHRNRSGGFSSSSSEEPSYTGPAGGRPASGLSRRRTQFRGPPPSFYRSGGWGAHSERRQRQAEAGRAAGGKAEYGADFGNGSGASEQAPPFSGSESGRGPFPGSQQQWGFDDDVQHFDREGHYRTQENVDGRRRHRHRREYVSTDVPETGVFWSFMAVSGVVIAALIPAIIFGKS